MSDNDQWIGNLGHMALADAMLGALLTDMLTVLGHARYPDPPKTVESAPTTKWAAKEVQKILDSDPALFGEAAKLWLSDVAAAADARNELLHAVALNQCDTCGAASEFIHPRSGKEVDRSEETVRQLTERIWELRSEGKAVAERIAELVNARIAAYAKRVANGTGEIQNPPQVYPHHVTRRCTNCDSGGTGSVTVQVGPALGVWPDDLKASWKSRQDPDPSESRDSGSGSA